MCVILFSILYCMLKFSHPQHLPRNNVTDLILLLFSYNNIILVNLMCVILFSIVCIHTITLDPTGILHYNIIIIVQYL